MGVPVRGWRASKLGRMWETRQRSAEELERVVDQLRLGRDLLWKAVDNIRSQVLRSQVRAAKPSVCKSSMTLGLLSTAGVTGIEVSGSWLAETKLERQ